MALARYWNAGRLPDNCRTTDGRAVHVVYRGQWSYGYGPDFRGAILSLGHEPTIRGDVEIHLRATDWRQHGHCGNPMYDGVILHIVWQADTTIPSASPVLELRRYVAAEELAALPDPGGLDESLCSVFQQSATAARAVQIIERAGDARFEARCAVLEGELASAPPEQVLYAALMECMGYAGNTLPFRLLAEAVPYEGVASPHAATVAQRLRASSGLVEGADQSALLHRDQWKLARVRPANHPLRRIEGVAEVIARAERHGGLLPYLASTAAMPGSSALLARLQANTGEETLIGRDRAVEIAVNAVLPFASALARSEGRLEVEDAAQRLWRDMPRAGRSRVERAMRDHIAMPARSTALRTARHQQGLLHLYKRYCAQRLCDLCPLSQLAASDRSA